MAVKKTKYNSALSDAAIKKDVCELLRRVERLEILFEEFQQSQNGEWSQFDD